MIEQYSYAKTACANPETTTACYALSIQFNPDSIHTFMTQNHIIPWDAHKRPKVLLWLKQTAHAKPLLITDHDETATAIQQQADARAITLILPTGDQSEQQLQADDLPEHAIEYLKSKYHVDTILTAKIESTAEQTTSQWQYYNKYLHSWGSETQDTSTAINGAIDHIANYEKQLLASQQNQAPTNTVIEINNILSIDDFSIVSDHLSKYVSVQDVAIATIGPNYMALEVKHQGTNEDFLSELQNDTALQSSIDSPNFAGAQASYEWVTTSNTPSK